MKTIIVATNYSANANNAMKYAAALAKHTNAQLVLFNSFEFSEHALNTLLPASAVDEMIAENKERLKDIASKLSDTFGITVKSLTKTSDFKEELDYQVERLKADLVVIGVSEPYSEYLYESTTSYVLRHAKYPVLAVPENANFKGIPKILFAFDPNCMDSANKLPLLTEFATCFNAEVQVCHVAKNEMSIAANGNYSGYTSNASLAFDTLLHEVDHSYKDILTGDVVKGIEQGVKDFKADMLVMVPHKHGFWEGIWNKSKTRKMVRRTHIPILSLPNPWVAQNWPPFTEY